MMIQVIKDEDIMKHIGEYDVILIGTNVYCTLSQGVQRDVALNYPYVREKNLLTKYGDISKLGTILECVSEGEPTFILLYMYRGYPYKKDKNDKADFVDYEALKECLIKISLEYKDKKVGMTMIGCSRFDGNGSQDKILDMIHTYLENMDVTVYDFFQMSRDEKQIATRKRELELKAKDYTLYYQAVKERKEKAEKRFQRNGFARY